MGKGKSSWWAMTGLWIAAVALLLFSYALAGAGSKSTDRRGAKAGEYRLAGPYAHKNLTVYLIHGDEAWTESGFLTLTDALKRGGARVVETGSVNELTIENLCADAAIIVLSGDIVKGGRQDRTIVYDFVLEPGSGPQPVPVHCVESGRWSRRGDEAVGAFGSAVKALAGKAIKLGNRGKEGGTGQSEVWANSWPATSTDVSKRKERTRAPRSASTGTGSISSTRRSIWRTAAGCGATTSRT